MGAPIALYLPSAQHETNKQPSQDLEESCPDTKGKGSSGPGYRLPTKGEGTLIQSSEYIHIVVGLLLSLSFYTDDPIGIGERVNIFLFPDLSLSEIPEATLVARRWDNKLDSITLATFSYTASLLQRKKVSPFIGWEAAVSMLEQWEVFLEVILGPAGGHLVVPKLLIANHGDGGGQHIPTGAIAIPIYYE